MARVNFRNQRFEVPDTVVRRDLERQLPLEPNEIPVIARENGEYEAIDDSREYRIKDKDTIEPVKRLANG